jgi:hypothetical protein
MDDPKCQVSETGRFLIALVISAILASTVLTSMFFFFLNLSCHAGGYRNGYFMAYCQNNHFNDYEHGAYYYNLEPRLIENVKKADVLFLGDSCAQTAFSTETLFSYFEGKKLRPYLFGFGYAENGRFPLHLIKKWSLEPRVLVVSVSTFFSDLNGTSLPAQNLLREQLSVKIRYHALRWFQDAQKRFCSTVPAFCDNKKLTIFRSIEDGRWKWFYSNALPYLHTTIDPSKHQLLKKEVIEMCRLHAQEFLATNGLNIKAGCIVITGVPYPGVNMEDLANGIGEGLGVRIINSPVSNLTTLDGTHLDKGSAERWSEAFVKQLDPVLAECIGSKAGP